MSGQKYRLDDITHLITKGTTPTKDQGFSESGVNFIKAEALNGGSALNPKGIFHINEDIHQHLKRSILQEDDVLLTIAGVNIGKCGIVKSDHLPANTNQAVGIMRVDRAKADPRYINYWFKQKRTFAFIQGLNAQAAQPNINLSMLKNIKIPLPSLAEQRKIAAILSAYDDLIENNRRRIQLLEQAARLLHKEWFVHRRFPGHQHVKIKGGIPEGWKRRKIADVCKTVGGGTPSTKISEYWNGGITWVVPTDVTKNNCLTLLDSERKITEKGLRKSSAKMVPAGTILMTSRASVGFFALIDREVCTNQGFINIIPHEDEFRMYILFNLISRVSEIRSNSKGTTYPEISKGRFRDMDIVLPVKPLINEFGERAGNII